MKKRILALALALLMATLPASAREKAVEMSVEMECDGELVIAEETEAIDAESAAEDAVEDEPLDASESVVVNGDTPFEALAEIPEGDSTDAGLANSVDLMDALEGAERDPEEADQPEDLAVANAALPALNKDSDGTYHITSAGDWDSFANMVDNGYSFTGEKVVLMFDVGTVSTTAGTLDNPFSGHFDGGGNTLTVDINKSRRFSAPFCCIDSATIENLTLAGTVATTEHDGGGLVGRADGANIIKDITVSAEITGNGYCGGILGNNHNAVTTMSNCAFTGTVSCADGYCGGLVGWSDSSTLNLSGCVFSGTFSGNAKFHPIALKNGDATVSGSAVGCYYTENPTLSGGNVAIAGRPVEKTPPTECLTRTVSVRGTAYYMPATTMINPGVYTWTGNPITVTPTVTFDDKPLAATNYTIRIDGTDTDKVTNRGTYTLTVCGVNANGYYGSASASFKVYSDLKGKGTESEPYEIYSESDWVMFAENILGDQNATAHYKLMDNISGITTMVGTEEHPFRGTFDGGGKTLTVNINDTSGADEVAPFRAICQATIKNLTVEGSVSTNGSLAAGLVGFIKNGTSGTQRSTSTIESCVVNAAVSNSQQPSWYSSGGYVGGIVAYPSSYVILYMKNCEFGGSLSASGSIGGLMGLGGQCSPRFYNCLFKGSYTGNGRFHPIAFRSSLIVEQPVSQGNYYTLAPTYVGTLAPLDGTLISVAEPTDSLATTLTVHGAEYYLPGVTSIELGIYRYTGSAITVVPSVTLGGTLLVAGTDYTVSVDGASTSEVTDVGAHTLTVSGVHARGYYGSASITFRVLPALKGSGTYEAPYLISSVDDWATFAANVNGGTACDGYYKLSQSIEGVTETVGTETHSFAGVFDGGGYTITAAIVDTSNSGTAPFRYINGATIKDLTVSGSVRGGIHAAALVGFSKGQKNRIDNCVVSATVKGGSHIGGVLGHALNSDIAIENCVFKGLLDGGSYDGIFFGWGEDGGTKTLTHCLYLFQEDQYVYNLALVHKNAGEVTVTDCYRNLNRNIGGSYIYLLNELPKGMGRKVMSHDGVDYYKAGTLTVTTENHDYTGSALTIAPTVTFNGAAVDSKYYSYAITDSQGKIVDSVVGQGDYTLIVTADGEDYVGTCATPFHVFTDLTTDMNGCILIRNVADLLAFANEVAGGADYSGRTVKLAADIGEVTVPIGTAEHPFAGTFDGDGHTITLRISDKAHEGTALFRCICGATIRNLTAAGRVDGKKFAAALVGCSTGKGNRIENCRITADVLGDYYVGGVLGNATDTDIAIDNCVFKGRLEEDNTSNKGVFYGYCDGEGTRTLSNCTYLVKEGQNTNYLYLAQRSSNRITITDCYRNLNKNIGGTYICPLDSLPNGVGRQVITDGDIAYYAAGILSVMVPNYDYTGRAIHLEPEILYDSTKLSASEYTVAIRDSDGLEVANAVKKGTYTLTVELRGKGRVGSATATFHVNDSLTSGADGAYLIQDAEDWYAFAGSVARGNDYSGYTVKLAANVSGAADIVGTQEHPFRGIFDGNGKTLNVSIADSSGAMGTAPFRYIDDATIRNMTVTGSIVASGHHMAGLVGFSSGNCAIEDCAVDVDISGGNYAGGIVGHGGTSTLALTRCVFGGSISAETKIGGLVGWNDDATLRFTDCLFKGARQGNADFHPVSLQSGSGAKATVTRCYTIQGQSKVRLGNTIAGCTAALVDAAEPQDGLYRGIVAADSKTYYMSCTLEDFEVRGTSANDIGLCYVLRDAEGRALEPGKDFAQNILKDGETTESMTAPGEYTMIVTGLGNYHGTASHVFTVRRAVAYVDARGNPLSCAAYTEVDARDAQWSDGWYVVKGDDAINIRRRIVISGKVNLILCNGCKLRIDEGIDVGWGTCLTIWGQSGHTGELISGQNCDGPLGFDKAGIGEGNGSEAGTIIINGGKLDARGGYQEAGIGGRGGGTVVINNGNITARGSFSAPGIGGNLQSIVITGGVIEAHGGADGAGIGTGHNNACGVLHISGGTIKAYGGDDASGIGLGLDGSIGDFEISGGTIEEAVGGERSAGIGGGFYCDNVRVTISGGTIVSAKGANGAPTHNDPEGGGAGIGGGENNVKVSVTIKGDAVIKEARGGCDAAGIGGGWNSYADYSEISVWIGENAVIESAKGGNAYHSEGGGAGIGSGSIQAGRSSTVKADIAITGGTVSATGSRSGAGIGASGPVPNGIYAESVHVAVTGGNVTATGGIGGQATNGSEITLGWTNAGDSIQSSGYEGAVSIQRGKALKVENSDVAYRDAVADVTALAEKKLVPDKSFYAIHIDDITGGSVIALPSCAKPSETITLTVNVEKGYVLRGIPTVTGTNLVEVSKTDAEGVYTFVMPASEVAVAAEILKLYKIDVDNSIANGTVTADAAEALAGEPVALTVEPSPGYTIGRVTVNDKAIAAKSGGYGFNMPGEDVVVSAVFVALSVPGPIQPAVTGIQAVGASGAETPDGRIAPVNDGMEYSADGGASWTKVPEGATEITGLPAGDYLIRLAETATHAAGEPVKVTVVVRTAQPAPERVAAGSEQGTITGLDDTMEFSVDGITWTPIPAGTVVLTGLPTGEYLIRKAATPDKNPGSVLKVAVQGAKVEPLLATLTTVGKNAMRLKWNAVDGAEGYEVVFDPEGSTQEIVFVGNSVDRSMTDLTQGTVYATSVKAYRLVCGQKVYIGESPVVRAIAGGSNGKYANPKTVKISKKTRKLSLRTGKSKKIKASVTKSKKSKKLLNGIARLRYVSDDVNVATVSAKGKVKAVGKGRCKIYVIAANGAYKTVAVTVK